MSVKPMRRLEETVEEYRKLQKRLEELRKELYGVIIKYLIKNSGFLQMCTEFAISKNLGLKRSTVRKILKELVENKVLAYQEMGRIKAYYVTSVNYALEAGYVSFSRKEFPEIFGVKEVDKQKFSIGSGEYFITATSLERKIRYKGREATLLERLVLRFFNYLNTYPMGKHLSDLFPGLDELIPEAYSLGKLYEASLGMGFLSQVLMVKVDPSIISDKEKVKEVFKREIRERLEYVLERLTRFMGILEEIGFHGFVEWSRKCSVYIDVIAAENIERVFRKEHLWAVTFMLREACKVAKKVGIEEEFIRKCLRLADILDLAVEKEYGGKEKEGMSLEEWYRSQKK